MKKTYIRDGRAPIPQRETISKMMSANKGKNTKPELWMRKALFAAGIRGYRIHLKQMPGRPDIVFLSKKVAVFVNGCYWHRCPHCQLHSPKTNSKFWEKKFEANVLRDQKKITALQDLHWRTITIWECKIKRDIDSCVAIVKLTLKSS